MKSLATIAGATLDFDFDALPQLQGATLPEGQPDEENAYIAGSAGILGTGPAGDDGIGDFLDLSAPATIGIALGGDRRRGLGGDPGNVELVDLGLDS